MKSPLARSPAFAIPLVFLAMLAVSWRRWTSPIADSGREMDLPLRLMNGELLYRDVHYLYPPLSPYFNALLYRLFGPHLDVLLLGGIVCAALIAALCYRIARRLLAPGEASIATAGVVIWCLFKPAGNLISPYSFAALHGMMFSLGALLFTLRYAEGVQNSGVQSSAFRLRSHRDLIAAGISIGLAAITKQEFALAGGATVTAAILFLHGNRWKDSIAKISMAAIPALLIALPVYAWLFQAVGWRTLVEDCHLFYTHLPASLVFYNAHRTGLDRPLFSLLQMLGAAGVMLAAAETIAIVSDSARRGLLRSYAVTGGLLLFVLAVGFVSGSQWDGSPLRALPLLLLAILVIAWRKRKSGADFSPRDGEHARTEVRATFIIAAYSMAVLARVALRVPSGGAFGGFFLPTSLILVFYLLVRALPAGLEGLTKDALAPQRARTIGQGLFIVMFVATAVVFGVRYRRNFDYELIAPRGHLFVPRASGQAIDEALKFLESETQPSEAIAVLPEGSDLTFLTGRSSPLRHQILIPGLMSAKDEQDAIAALQRRRVRYVLIVNRPMREFGAEAFGRDFYPTLGNWIEEHYRLVRTFGGAGSAQPKIGDPAFFIKVYAKPE